MHTNVLHWINMYYLKILIGQLQLKQHLWQLVEEVDKNWKDVIFYMKMANAGYNQGRVVLLVLRYLFIS